VKLVSPDEVRHTITILMFIAWILWLLPHSKYTHSQSVVSEIDYDNNLEACKLLFFHHPNDLLFRYDCNQFNAYLMANISSSIGCFPSHHHKIILRTISYSRVAAAAACWLQCEIYLCLMMIWFDNFSIYYLAVVVVVKKTQKTFNSRLDCECLNMHSGRKKYLF
jgi:hypothetical protein